MAARQGKAGGQHNDAGNRDARNQGERAVSRMGQHRCVLLLGRRPGLRDGRYRAGALTVRRILGVGHGLRRRRRLKERAHRHGFLAQQKGRRGRSRIRELDVTVDNLPVVKDIALVRHSGERNLGAGERTARVARGRATLASTVT